MTSPNLTGWLYRHVGDFYRLHPVESVWQFMGDNWLSNRIFSSYDNVLHHCCHTWNRLIDQPWRIMSTGLRQWAHGF